MGQVTLQVLDGLERGQIFRDCPTPVSIGREEDNTIRLNDERVSRFHSKIQEKDGQYILTDLESTNGTRVNGHPVHVHVLRIGDQLMIGRSVLLFGSPEQLAEQIKHQLEDEETHSREYPEFQAVNLEEECPDLFPGGPPSLPRTLDTVETAQISDLLAFIHTRLLRVLYSIQGPAGDIPAKGEVTISEEAWHRLQQLQMDLATYLKQIAEPQD